MGLLSAIGGIGGAIVGGPVGALAGFGLGSSIEAGEATADAAASAAAASRQTAIENRELNIERYGEAKDLLSPYIEDAETARAQLMIEMGLAPGEAGTAYMETPGYRTAMAGVEQEMANAGTLYSGRRIGSSEEAQGQFYANYMNLLKNMASPATATNLAALGVGQGANIGTQDITAQRIASDYEISGAQTRQAYMGDIVGAGAQIYGGYLAGQPPPQPYYPPTPTTTWV